MGKEYIPYNEVSISQFDEGNAIQIFDRFVQTGDLLLLKMVSQLQLLCRRRNIQGL